MILRDTSFDFSVFGGLYNEDLETGRVYKNKANPAVNYPSITTVLGSFKKEHIERWKQAVGAEKAAEVSEFASTRGTDFHECLEHFVVTGEHKQAATVKTDRMVQKIETVLKKDLDCWYNQEIALCSDILRVAGRCDLMGRFRGEDSILDYKTSMKVKTRQHIEDYFKQTCMYSICCHEFTKFRPKKLVILMCADGAPNAQVFVEDFDTWVKPTVDTVKEYYRRFR